MSWNPYSGRTRHNPYSGGFPNPYQQPKLVGGAGPFIPVPAVCGPPIDPLTIPGLIAFYDARLPGTIWQDAAKTMAATDGSIVKAWENSINLGVHDLEDSLQPVVDDPIFRANVAGLGPALEMFAGVGSNHQGLTTFNSFLGLIDTLVGVSVIIKAAYPIGWGPLGWVWFWYDSTEITNAHLSYVYEAVGSPADGIQFSVSSSPLASARADVMIAGPIPNIVTAGRGQGLNVTNPPPPPIVADFEANIWVDGVDAAFQIRPSSTLDNVPDTFDIAKTNTGSNLPITDMHVQQIYLYDRYLDTPQMCGASIHVKNQPPRLDILEHWWDFTDISTLFQDDLGVSPVTADGQQVGKVVSKGNGSEDLIQTALAARPVFIANALNGYSGIRMFKSSDAPGAPAVASLVNLVMAAQALPNGISAAMIFRMITAPLIAGNNIMWLYQHYLFEQNPVASQHTFAFRATDGDGPNVSKAVAQPPFPSVNKEWMMTYNSIDNGGGPNDLVGYRSPGPAGLTTFAGTVPNVAAMPDAFGASTRMDLGFTPSYTWELTEMFVWLGPLTTQDRSDLELYEFVKYGALPLVLP